MTTAEKMDRLYNAFRREGVEGLMSILDDKSRRFMGVQASDMEDMCTTTLSLLSPRVGGAYSCDPVIEAEIRDWYNQKSILL